MKLAIPLLLLMLSPIESWAQSDTDRDAIMKTFDAWSEGWALVDADLAVQDYAEDVDWTNAFGDRFEGREKLRAGLARIFKLGFVMAGTSAENEFTDIDFLSPDIAIVRSKLVRTGQQMSSGELMPDRHINHLRVYQKRDGRWLIVSHMISQAQEKR